MRACESEKVFLVPSFCLTFRHFLWDKHLNDFGRISTWSSEIKDILTRNNLAHIYNQGMFPLHYSIKNLKDSLFQKDKVSWQSDCRNMPKLRTFMKFKNFDSDSPSPSPWYASPSRRDRTLGETKATT